MPRQLTLIYLMSNKYDLVTIRITGFLNNSLYPDMWRMHSLRFSSEQLEVRLDKI